MDFDSDSQHEASFGAMDPADHQHPDDECMELSGNISQLSEEDDLTQQIMNKYMEKGLVSKTEGL